MRPEHLSHYIFFLGIGVITSFLYWFPDRRFYTRWVPAAEKHELVLRDLASSAVPVLAALALNGRQLGSLAAGCRAAGLLLISGLGSALALLLLQSWRLQRLRAAGTEIA